jgi:hypothetical protein
MSKGWPQTNIEIEKEFEGVELLIAKFLLASEQSLSDGYTYYTDFSAFRKLVESFAVTLREWDLRDKP